MTPTVFIIILNWNGKENTIDCLESISKCEVRSAKCEVIVVDNGSEEKFKVQSASWRTNFKVTLIENERNLGFAGGNNVGIRYALEQGADYVLILNNDTIVEPYLVLELLKEITSDSTIGIVAPKIYFAKGFEFHKDRYAVNELGKVIWYAGGIMDWENILGHHKGVDEVDRGAYESTQETDFASGCAMLIKREVFEKVGLFDEKYFLYYEDNDLCKRIKMKGFRIVFVPKARLWHKNAGSAGGAGSTLQDYYITRNRMLFGMRYATVRAKIAILKESVRILISGRKWQRRGVVDFYFGRFGEGSFHL